MTTVTEHIDTVSQVCYDAGVTMESLAAKSSKYSQYARQWFTTGSELADWIGSDQVLSYYFNK